MRVTKMIVAAAFVATLGSARAESSPVQPDGVDDPGAPTVTTLRNTDASTNLKTTSHDDATGSGSGEPGRADPAKEGTRVKEDDAIQEYNHRKFLEGVWRASP